MDFVECTRDHNLRSYSPRTLLTAKVVMQTLQTAPKLIVQRKGTVTPLKAANHLWLSKNQVDFPLQQLKWKKTSR